MEVDTAPGYCLGMVLAPETGAFRRRVIKTPRVLLQLPDAERWLVSDLGRWVPGRGTLWRLRVEASGKVQRRAIATGLSLPHSLATGPDGAIYLAEMHRISRVDPDTGALTPVVEGLPANELHVGRHPLSHFVFDGNGDLLVNVGADTDQCEDQALRGAATCVAADGEPERAVLRRYTYAGDGAWDSRFSIEARGLRNSLVLLRHESGTLLQAENSYDFAPSEWRPHDEINVVKPGAHYGWPYCFDGKESTPAWQGHPGLACGTEAYERPALLLPPHSAPLGGVYYAGTLLGALQGKLILGFHGYFPTGSRLVAYPVDGNGVPLAEPPLDLTPGWDLRAGQRPSGAPVAVTVAQDGSLWIADDRNATILRLSVDRP